MNYLITKKMDDNINQSILSGDIEELDKYLKMFSDNNLKNSKVNVEELVPKDEQEDFHCTKKYIEKDFSNYLWCKSANVMSMYNLLNTTSNNSYGSQAADKFLNYVLDLYKDEKQSSYQFHEIFINQLISSASSKNIEMLNKILDYNMIAFDNDEVSYNLLEGLVDGSFYSILERVLNEYDIDLKKDFEAMENPLIIKAAFNVNDKMLKLLIENGADIKTKSKSSNEKAFSIILDCIPLEKLDFIIEHIFEKEFIDNLKGNHDYYVSKFLLNDFDNIISKYSDDDNEIRDVLSSLLEIASKNNSNKCYRLILNKIYDDHIKYQSLNKASVNLKKIIRSALKTEDIENLNTIICNKLENDENFTQSNIFFIAQVEYLLLKKYNHQVFSGLLGIAIERSKKDKSYIDKFLGNITMFGDNKHLNYALEIIDNNLENYSPIYAMNRAVELENHNALEILANHPNVKINMGEYFPLGEAANNDDLISINILLDAGADPTHKPKDEDDNWLLECTHDKEIKAVLERSINKITMGRIIKKDIKESQFYNNKIKRLKVKRIGGFNK